jgi:hypothetical protein
MDGETRLLLRAPESVQSPHISPWRLFFFEKREGEGVAFKVAANPGEKAEGVGLSDVLRILADLKQSCVVDIRFP